MSRYTLCAIHGVRSCQQCKRPGVKLSNAPHEKVQRKRTPGRNKLAGSMPDISAYVDALGLHRVCELCKVHRTTVTRWVNGTVTPPASALLVLQLECSGQRPGPEWQGWRMHGEFLYSPAGDKFTPGDVLAAPWQVAANESLRAQVARLEAQLIAATKAAAVVDQASNDSALWPNDVRSKAFK